MKLSAAQQRVMKWLGKGWTTYPGAGSAVMLNGERLCNVDTMTALRRAGLVFEDADRCWSATPAGKELTQAHNL